MKKENIIKLTDTKIKKINITKLTENQILEMVATGNNFNFKTPTGFILLQNGLGTMQKDGKIFVIHNGKWKKVFND